MLKRKNQSHKGQNGRVCIIGGSARFHGAPIFAALGAEATGVDLVFPIVPHCHAEVTKQASYNFICDYFKLNYLTAIDLFKINKILKEVDALVIGPGLGEKGISISAVYDILKKISVPVVIDASALLVIKEFLGDDKILPPHTVITPHCGEFENMTAQKLSNTIKKNEKIVQDFAAKLEGIILLKGEKDIIANAENALTINRTGNAGMTVGGTGDVLSGVIGGLIAQGMKPFEACKMAVELLGNCGDILFKERCYSYTTMDLLKKIPEVMCRITD